MTPKQITCAIPTHVGGVSLISTLHSLYTQSAYNAIREILVVVDGNSLDKYTRRAIRNRKLKIREIPIRKGQAGTLNYIFHASTSDLLIITNDDVVLHKHAVRELIRSKKIYNPDLISGAVMPFSDGNILQHLIGIGYEINHEIIRQYRKDTYLSCNGRLVALSKKMYSSIRLPEKLTNNDAYFYLYAKLHHLAYHHEDKAKVFFTSPSTLKEHINQSTRFQHSRNENEQHLKTDLKPLYTVPIVPIIRAFCIVFWKFPVRFAGYIIILIYSRMHAMNTHIPKTGIWNTDKTTKMIHRD